MGKKFANHHALKNPPKFLLPLDYAIQTYIERYLCGDSIQAIAHELKVDAETVRYRFKRWCLSGKADKSYADLVTEMLVNRIAWADEELGKCASMLELGIAREHCRYARMDFERRRPHLYGQRVEMTVTGPAAIFLGLSDPGLTIEGNAPKLIETTQDVVNHDIEKVQDVENIE